MEMELDKSKVYTALNADEVPIGSYGFVANSINELKYKVSRSDSFIIASITAILDDTFAGRFMIDNSTRSYPFFYLLKKPAEKKYCPYLDTNEMIFDFKNRFNQSANTIPLIWVENAAGDKKLITSFNGDSVLIPEQSPISMDVLFALYKYTNNSPCGRLVEEEDDK